MSVALFPVTLILLLVFMNGFFVAAEFAIAAAPRTRVTQMARAGSSAARRVLEILHNTELLNRYISTAQVGITIASLGLGMYGEHVVADWLLEPLEHWGWLGDALAHTVATVVAVSILTYLHVVLGEMVPKSLALQNASTAAISLVSIMGLAEMIFLPLTVVLNRIGGALLRITGLPLTNTEAQLISSEELAYIVEESSEVGLLDATEQLYLENVLDFGERTAGQIMTPRTRMVTMAVETSQEETLELIGREMHSRYPVYANDRDNIVGILHVKDLARALVAPPGPFDLRNLLRPAVYVPEALPVDELLVRMRTDHIQIAVVVDEYGGTAGLVTLEDIVEELIGEIQDEFDEEIAPFKEIGSGVLRVRGDLLLGELAQHYDLDIENEEADTVGGLVMALLGKVARPGEAIDYKGIRFEVEVVDGLAIQTVRVTLPRVSSEGASEDR